MSDLQKFIGIKFKELKPQGLTFATPSDFGERVITDKDVAEAFPQSLIGLINTAAIHYHLVDEIVIDSMRDTS